MNWNFRARSQGVPEAERVTAYRHSGYKGHRCTHSLLFFCICNKVGMISHNYRVGQKTAHYTLVHIFAKY